MTPEGEKEVDRLAELAAAFNISVLLISHSGKARAKETAIIMANHLKPAASAKEMKGLSPNDDVTGIVKNLHPAENIMLVGHLPFLEKLVSYLVTGTTDLALVRFQRGGIVCLDKDAEDQFWYIKWALMPDMK